MYSMFNFIGFDVQVYVQVVVYNKVSFCVWTTVRRPLVAITSKSLFVVALIIVLKSGCDD